MIQIIHLSVVSLFNGKDTFEIHHQQQQQCLKIVLFYAPFFVFKTVQDCRMMNIFFCRVTPLIVH